MQLDVIHHYTALTLPLRLLLPCKAFYPATLRSTETQVKPTKHINNNMQMTVRTGTMRDSHVPPVAAQSAVFVVDEHCRHWPDSPKYQVIGFHEGDVHGAQKCERCDM